MGVCSDLPVNPAIMYGLPQLVDLFQDLYHNPKVRELSAETARIWYTSDGYTVNLIPSMLAGAVGLIVLIPILRVIFILWEMFIEAYGLEALVAEKSNALLGEFDPYGERYSDTYQREGRDLGPDNDVAAWAAEATPSSPMAAKILSLAFAPPSPSSASFHTQLS